MVKYNSSANVVSTHNVYSTESVSQDFGSNLQNYADYYDEWDNEPEDQCPSCYGTGLDDDEWYDCITCGGEGYIPRSLPLTR